MALIHGSLNLEILDGADGTIRHSHAIEQNSLVAFGRLVLIEGPAIIFLIRALLIANDLSWPEARRRPSSSTNIRNETEAR
jgi:hypothetical protein